MSHSLPADLSPCDLYAAAFTNSALEVDLLVFSAMTLPVLLRTEDSLSEQTVLLGLEGTVVNGLGLFDLSVRPLPDKVGGRKSYLYLVKFIELQFHVLMSSSQSSSSARLAISISSSSLP